MILDIIVDEQTFPINIPQDVLEEGESFFAKIDQDMDQGWQMHREWVDRPDRLQRCRIVADRLLTAIEAHNQPMMGLMAAYILKRLPGVAAVRVDTHGEMQETEFIMQP